MVRFNQNSDQLCIPPYGSSPAPISNAGEFTICAWIRPQTPQTNAFPVWFGLCDVSDAFNKTIYFYHNASTGDEAWHLAGSGGTSDLGNGSGRSVGNWEFVALTRASNGAGKWNYTAYWRNLSSTSFTTSTKSNSTDGTGPTWTQLYIGNLALGGQANGEICDLRGWEVALTAAQLWEESMRMVPPRRSSELKVAYPLRGNPSTNGRYLVDFYSGNNNTLTQDGANLPTEGDYPPTLTGMGLAHPYHLIYTPRVAGPVPGIVVVGLAPTVLRGTLVEANPGAIELAGLAPTMLRGALVEVNSGAIELAGLAPTVLRGTLVESSQGSIELRGLEPTILLGRLVLSSPGSVELRGLEPTLLLGTSNLISASSGAVELVGLAPTLAPGRLVLSSPGVVELAGLEPTLLLGTSNLVSAPSGAIELAGLDPTLILGANGVTIDVPVSSIELRGLDPTLRVATVVTPQSGAIELEGLCPDVLRGALVPASAGAVELRGLDPTLLLGTSNLLTVPLAVVELRGLEPTVILTPGPDNVLVSASRGELELRGLEPTLLGVGNPIPIPSGFEGLEATVVDGSVSGILIDPDVAGTVNDAAASATLPSPDTIATVDGSDLSSEVSS